MSKLDVYLRSIEKFGAAGAVLTSGQAVMLRFPTGDRHATQVTPHDQLVVMIREVAPPAALAHIDGQRPARFEIDSQGVRYAISVTARPNAWTVAIEPAAAPAPAATPPPVAAVRPRPAAPAVDPGGDMLIERGQYDGAAPSGVTTTSGSAFLDQLTTQARGSRASDIYLATGVPPMLRAAGELAAAGDRPLDAELLSRELGAVASGEARAAWAERGTATFAYGDGAGRVRVTLTRDQRGPGAALRLLHGEGLPLDRIGLAAAGDWLDGRGLVMVCGPAGAGKTTTVAALVRALGERRRSVVAIEDPIEIVHTAPSISQRAVGEHVPSFTAAVAGALREGADAIVIGDVTSADAAIAVIDAIAGGQLVIAALVIPRGQADNDRVVDQLVDRLSVERREHGRTLCADHLVGTITPVVARNGSRTFEVTRRGDA